MNIDKIRVINPSTKLEIESIDITKPQEIVSQFNKAQLAYDKWSRLSLKERFDYIKKFKKVVLENCEIIIQTISQEIGKPSLECYLAEIAPTLEMCDWLLNKNNLPNDNIFKLSNPVMWTKKNQIIFEPLGVIGIISPWNYPFAIPLMSTLMALVLGNVVMLKPSEKSSLTALLIEDLFKKIKLPQNVFSLVIGEKNTGIYFSKLPFSRLVFTGSPSVGKAIMNNCSELLTPISLELGGKDAAIILPDANVKNTVTGVVWGAFTNCGQACASIERCYIVKSKNTDKLIDDIIEATRKLKFKNTTNDGFELGPLIDQHSIDRIDNMVQDAIINGAQLLTGGKIRHDLEGYFYEPTVLLNVNHNMLVMREEIFGPILPIMIVDTLQEAINLANDSQFGLCASIWTKDLSKAKLIASQLKVGTVTVNDCLYTFACPQLPWGGVKQSGFGRSHSYYNTLDFVNIKVLSQESANAMQKLWWFPYSKNSELIAKSGIYSLHMSNLNQGIKNGIKIVKSVTKSK